MFEPDTLIAENSVTLYIDYPEALTPEANEQINLDEAQEVVKQVIEATAALLTESHLSSIPIFMDRLYELVDTIVQSTIEGEKYYLDIPQTCLILHSFVSELNQFISPVVRGYIPPMPELFVTTLIDVVCRCDCVLVTIHY